MGPDHGTGRGGRWSSLAPHAALLMPHRLCCDSLWLDRVGKKPSLKADLLIYTYIVTVSGQYLSVAIKLSNKMDFSYYGFTNPVT